MKILVNGKMNAVSIFVVIIMLLSHFIIAQSQTDEVEDEEMCLPFRRAPMARRPATNMQGRPGKTGPPGAPGKCTCNKKKNQLFMNILETL